jgi:hypothetical protein
MPQAGVRNIPGAIILGGGIMVQTGGSLVGAIGVSGGPCGDADDACATPEFPQSKIKSTFDRKGGSSAAAVLTPQCFRAYQRDLAWMRPAYYQ